MLKLLVLVLLCAVGCFVQEIEEKSTSESNLHVSLNDGLLTADSSEPVISNPEANKCGMRYPNGVGFRITEINNDKEAKFGKLQLFICASNVY